MESTRLLERFVVALVILGLLAVGGGISLGRPVATHVGITLLWVAFSTVVINNYRNRRPVQTRGGVVQKEDGAFRYALPYLPFVFMALISGFMVLAAWVMP